MKAQLSTHKMIQFLLNLLVQAQGRQHLVALAVIVQHHGDMHVM